MRRCFANLLCDDPKRAARFYGALLGMRRVSDSGWFVVLGHDAMPGLELGLLDRTHETVPPEARARPAGVIVTFAVDDVHVVEGRARAMAAEVVDGPTDLSYGQRRLLLRDPDGTLVDVSSATPAGA